MDSNFPLGCVNWFYSCLLPYKFWNVIWRVNIARVSYFLLTLLVRRQKTVFGIFVEYAFFRSRLANAFRYRLGDMVKSGRNAHLVANNVQVRPDGF